MHQPDARTWALQIAILGAALLAFTTELLGFFHLLTPLPVAICWLLAALSCFRLRLPARPALAPLDWLLLTPVLLILAILAAVAWLSAPNTYDGMGYHLPRVVMWIQQSNVDHFPTSYLNQLQMPPFAEYVILHTMLLTGTDRLANLVQWAGFAGSLLAVSALAADLGAARRGQLLAILIAAAIPNAILQSTGVKNECVLSFWLLCACLFTRRAVHAHGPLWPAALSIALALFTKGTAYLFLPPFSPPSAWAAHGAAPPASPPRPPSPLSSSTAPSTGAIYNSAAPPSGLIPPTATASIASKMNASAPASPSPTRSAASPPTSPAPPPTTPFSPSTASSASNPMTPPPPGPAPPSPPPSTPITSPISPTAGISSSSPQPSPSPSSAPIFAPTPPAGSSPGSSSSPCSAGSPTPPVSTCRSSSPARSSSPPVSNVSAHSPCSSASSS